MYIFLHVRCEWAKFMNRKTEKFRFGLKICYTLFKEIHALQSGQEKLESSCTQVFSCGLDFM